LGSFLAVLAVALVVVVVTEAVMAVVPSST
jgi:hypothetical protein